MYHNRPHAHDIREMKTRGEKISMLYVSTPDEAAAASAAGLLATLPELLRAAASLSTGVRLERVPVDDSGVCTASVRWARPSAIACAEAVVVSWRVGYLRRARPSGSACACHAQARGVALGPCAC